MRASAIWPEIKLDREAGASTLRHQIGQQLSRAIRDGRLAYGVRLPSSRLMARVLTVSRGTVVEAYEGLLELGLIVAVPGSGMRVVHPSPRVPDLGNLKRAAAAAHYPARVCVFDDLDGTPLYLNVLR
ncbi:winged helix-turn-helix domain-containing protein [Granulicella aggregans]|jgi:GntR family transcriptional regulator/MocR family aminotransferase|uniref:winged helix-turn-helix domain-containing protein n=1 Tax=Granulicella aggregans TaxID=474949 RepID=UPI0021E03C72|nr:winged helix-turn-helix domain-containing protein [Granulicella aggregans]